METKTRLFDCHYLLSYGAFFSRAHKLLERITSYCVHGFSSTYSSPKGSSPLRGGNSAAPSCQRGSPPCPAPGLTQHSRTRRGLPLRGRALPGAPESWDALPVTALALWSPVTSRSYRFPELQGPPRCASGRSRLPVRSRPAPRSPAAARPRALHLQARVSARKVRQGPCFLSPPPAAGPTPPGSGGARWGETAAQGSCRPLVGDLGPTEGP